MGNIPISIILNCCPIQDVVDGESQTRRQRFNQSVRRLAQRFRHTPPDSTGATLHDL